MMGISSDSEFQQEKCEDIKKSINKSKNVDCSNKVSLSENSFKENNQNKLNFSFGSDSEPISNCSENKCLSEKNRTKYLSLNNKKPKLTFISKKKDNSPNSVKITRKKPFFKGIHFTFDCLKSIKNCSVKNKTYKNSLNVVNSNHELNRLVISKDDNVELKNSRIQSNEKKFFKTNCESLTIETLKWKNKVPNNKSKKKKISFFDDEDQDDNISIDLNKCEKINSGFSLTFQNLESY